MRTFVGFNKISRHLVNAILFVLLLGSAAFAEKKAEETTLPGNLAKSAFPFFLDRTGIHTGNLIRTAYSNFGNIGSRTLVEARMEWPVGSGVLYGFEYVFFVGSEVITDQGDTLHIVSERYTGSSRDVPIPETHNWGWEPKEGFFNDGNLTIGVDEDLNNNGILDPGEDLNRNGLLDSRLINFLEYPAMSHLPETWPYDWPEGSHPGDTGSRRNRWNGEFGAFVRADQESYYIMDDRANDEFPYYPFPEDTLSFLDGASRGVGLHVEVRNYQWNHPLAEDILISIYQVKNVSSKSLPRNIMGMYVDADLGKGDADDDASFFDTVDDITWQWDLDFLDRQGRAIGYFGFAFLQSPGLIDGIDNDGDGMVDESQEDGIDNDGDWVSYSDLDGNGVWDFEDTNLNGQLDPGEDMNGNGLLDREPINDDVGSDGLGPDDLDYPGADSDGTEGNGVPDEGEPNFEFTDNDEIDQIGLTSYFAAEPSHNMKNDEDFWLTKIQPDFFTPAVSGMDVAFTYGSGFFDLPPGYSERFAIACLFGNDFDDIIRNKRTMQRIYDADYDFAKPPLNSNLTAIAGNNKVYLNWTNRAEDSRDPIYGNDFGLYKIYRSSDPHFNDIKTITDAFGNPILWEPIVQFDYKDGLVGAHPIALQELGVSYDMGSDTGLRHSYVDTDVVNGRTYYYAVVSVDKGYDIDFFERGLTDKMDLSPISPTESSKIIEVDLLGNVLFMSANVAVVTPTGPAAGVDEPELAMHLTHLSGPATGSIMIELTVPDSIKDENYQITFTDTTVALITNSFTLTQMSTGDTVLSGNADFNDPALEMMIIDGFKIFFDNVDEPEINTVKWQGNSNLQIDISKTAVGIPVDFEIELFDEIVDISFSPVPSFRKPVKFKIWNLTDSLQMEFMFIDWEPGVGDTSGVGPDSTISKGDILTLIASRTGNNAITGWKLEFDVPSGQFPVSPKPGEKLKVTTLKPFSSSDVYEFSMQGWKSAINLHSALDDIYVVPDPYVAVNVLEPKQPAALTGRGERRVEFVNLPQRCTIRIFTVSGKLVKTIKHDVDFKKGREPWDLLTKDGIEVAYGIYFYHVDAGKNGEKIGRFAVIK